MPSGLETTLVILAWTYIAGLAFWLLVRRLLGDRPLLLFFFTSIGPLVALAAPIVLLAGLVLDNTAIIAAGALSLVVCLVLWLPPLLRNALRRPVFAAGPTLRVASFNLLWRNDDTDAVIDVLRSLDADVIALQEVNPAHAEAIQSQLSAEYPHQHLEPRELAFGNGMISRIPFTPLLAALPDGDWIGDAIIAGLDFEGRAITVVGCHAAPVKLRAIARERQARALVRYGRRIERPYIVMGDFNSTPQHVAYQILARGLQDVWLAAGRGLGHTFPGAAWSRAQGDGLPAPLRPFIPRWLIRIDHIFVSAHWRAAAARTGPAYGGSDHRPVIAELMLRE
jgi:endonuclease/exonuclease/phosphatase (EEP) superfamily protein YafD